MIRNFNYKYTCPDTDKEIEDLKNQIKDYEIH